MTVIEYRERFLSDMRPSFCWLPAPSVASGATPSAASGTQSIFVIAKPAFFAGCGNLSLSLVHVLRVGLPRAQRAGSNPQQVICHCERA